MKRNTDNQLAVTPSKTVERLVVYRVLLEELQANDKTHVFSSRIAELAGNTAAQVRRDLMAVGHSGNTRNGYSIPDLLRAIRALLDPPEGITVAIAGIGNLGRALLGHFALLQPRYRIVGAFDSDDNKAGRIICGCRIHPVRALADELARTPAMVGVITVPPDQAQRMADAFALAGVRAIVNFAPVPLRVPHTVWLDNMHITAALEKAAYFSRMNPQGG